MQAIHQHIQQTVSDLHRKAIDADRALDQLQQEQKGKFQTIFDETSGFSTQARRFVPYVQEVAEDWQQLKTLEGKAFEVQLGLLVKKIELVLTTIGQLKTTL